MCTYCNTTNYRKIYENHHGPIGKDSTGRTMEVHHIDGNHLNNIPENLTLLPILEHYEVHYNQQDWDACLAIAYRMKLSPEETSKLCSELNYNRVKQGTHPFMTRPDGTNLQTDRVEDGSHHFLGGAIQRRHAKDNVQRQIENGANMFMNNEWQRHKAQKQIEKGTHASQQKWVCDRCGMKGKGRSQLSQHKNGTNCKFTDILVNQQ